MKFTPTWYQSDVADIPSFQELEDITGSAYDEQGVYIGPKEKPEMQLVMDQRTNRQYWAPKEYDEDAINYGSAKLEKDFNSKEWWGMVHDPHLTVGEKVSTAYIEGLKQFGKFAAKAPTEIVAGVSGIVDAFGVDAGALLKAAALNNPTVLPTFLASSVARKGIKATAQDYLQLLKDIKTPAGQMGETASLYRASDQNWSATLDKYFPDVDENIRAHSTLVTIGSMAGQIGGSLLLAAATNGVGGLPAVATVFGSQQFYNIREEYLEKGFSLDSANIYAGLAAMAEGGLEAFGFSKWLKYATLKPSLRNHLIAGLMEASQEASQQTAEELITNLSGVREETLTEILAQIAISAVAGFIPGAGISMVSGGIGIRQEKAEYDLNKAIEQQAQQATPKEGQVIKGPSLKQELELAKANKGSNPIYETVKNIANAYGVTDDTTIDKLFYFAKNQAVQGKLGAELLQGLGNQIVAYKGQLALPDKTSDKENKQAAQDINWHLSQEAAQKYHDDNVKAMEESGIEKTKAEVAATMLDRIYKNLSEKLGFDLQKFKQVVVRALPQREGTVKQEVSEAESMGEINAIQGQIKSLEKLGTPEALAQKERLQSELDEKVDQEGKRGYISIGDTINEIVLGKNADISTLQHEMIHHFKNVIYLAAAQGNKNAIALQKQIDAIIEAHKDEVKQGINTEEEVLSEAFEAWLYGGVVAENETQQKLFDAMKQFFQDVYDSVKAITGIRIDPEIDMFFRQITGQMNIQMREEMAQAKEGSSGTMYQAAAMYKSPHKEFAKFFDKAKTNKKKSYFRFTSKSGVDVDILSDTLIHDEKHPAMNVEQWEDLMDNFDNITYAARETLKNRSKFKGVPILLSIDGKLSKYGVAVEIIPTTGRVLLTTGFNGTEKGINAWIQNKKSAETLPPIIFDLQHTTSKEVAGSFSGRSYYSIGDIVKFVKTQKLFQDDIKYDKNGKADINSPEFKKWFGNSKVVDENGKPLVVYHGTQNDFNSFKDTGTSRQIGARLGFFFTDSEEMGDKYADGGKVMPVYLSIQNPLIIEPNTTLQMFGENLDIGDPFNFFTQMDTRQSEQELKEALKQQRYDGIILRSTSVDTSFGEGIHDVYVAFDPTQIKSVYNKGTFDVKNPNIYFQDKEQSYRDDRAQRTGAQAADPKPSKERIASDLAVIKNNGVEKYQPKSRVVESVGNFAKHILLSVRQRAGAIDNKLKAFFDKLDYFQPNLEKKFASRANGFIKKFQGLTEDEKNEFDYYVYNQCFEELQTFLKDKGMAQEYNDVRQLLNFIYAISNQAGIDMNFVHEYFPTSMIDYAGFMDYLKGTDKWSYIAKALREADPEGVWSDKEKAEAINKLLRGYRLDPVSKPKNAKERTILYKSPELMRFYEHSDVALIKYLQGMGQALAINKAFGKGSGFDTDATIGAIVLDLVNSGTITHKEEQEVKKLLKSRLSYGATPEFIAMVKNVGYLQTMNNITSAITQLGDLYAPFYKYSFGTAIKSIFGKSEITKTDLGLDKIWEEFSDSSKTGIAVDKLFKVIGLEAMDSFGKNVAINASWLNLKEQAVKGDIALTERLAYTFGKDAGKVLADIKAGNITDDVKILIWSDLADTQPIGRSGVPTGYLDNPHGRLLYQLKTFMLNQISLFYADSLVNIQKGIKYKNKAQFLKGVGNGFKLVLLLTAGNAGADVLKNLIMGRDIDITDTVVSNLLWNLGVSKYTFYKGKRDGYVRSILSSYIMPPQISIGDDVYMDVRKIATGKRQIKDTMAVTYLPFGRAYYWWFGGGRTSEIEKAKKEKKAKRKKKK